MTRLRGLWFESVCKLRLLTYRGRYLDAEPGKTPDEYVCPGRAINAEYFSSAADDVRSGIERDSSLLSTAIVVIS